MEGAYYNGQYLNRLERLGYSQAEIDNKLESTFEEMFYGPEGVRLCHCAGPDMMYIEDTGNHDVRTEGMSYAMMFCVQMNRQKEFDCLWRWVVTHMYLTEGENAGYFAWSCHTDGSKNSDGPAPDGEEFFAMSLFFAGLVCYFLSNFISNTATAALLIPILTVVCQGMGDKLNVIGGDSTVLIGIAVAASAAMCLPISTPPNAIAYSTGLIEQKDMAKTGILVGLITLVLGFSLLIVVGKMGIL